MSRHSGIIATHLLKIHHLHLVQVRAQECEELLVAVLGLSKEIFIYAYFRPHVAVIGVRKQPPEALAHQRHQPQPAGAERSSLRALWYKGYRHAVLRH